MTHTPTPWFIAGEAPENLFGDLIGSQIVNAQGYAIAETHRIAILNGWHLKPDARHWGTDKDAHIDLPDGEDEANARRIVACVNALQGFSTEAIEAGAVQGLRSALEKIEALLHEPQQGDFDNDLRTVAVRDASFFARRALSQLAEASNA